MSNQDTTRTTAGTPAWGTRRGPVVPYVPGLDGLRALAVIAVIVYHANRSWLGGGFLGVEVFFVIASGIIHLAHCNNHLLRHVRSRSSGHVARRCHWWRHICIELVPSVEWFVVHH